MWRRYLIPFATAPLLAGSIIWAQDACLEGRLMYRQRSYASAQDLLWTCWKQNVSSSTADVAYLLAQTFRELKNYEAGLGRLKNETASGRILDRLYLEGYLLFRMREHHRSIAVLHRGFKLNPADWRIHHLFALNFVVLNRRDAATHEFQTAIQLEPLNPELHYHLSRHYYTLNRFEPAINEAKQALVLAPDYVEAQTNLALCYQATGQMDAARREHEASVRLAEASRSPDEWPYLNYGEWLLSIGEASKALVMARQAIRAVPRSALAWAFSGKVNTSLRNYPEAKKELLEALKLDPDPAAPYYQLAMICRHMGDADSARLYLQEFARRKAHSNTQRQSFFEHAAGSDAIPPVSPER